MADINIKYSGYHSPDSYVIKDKTYVPLCVTSHNDKDKAIVVFNVHKLGNKTTIKRVGTLFKGIDMTYLKFSIDKQIYVLDIKYGNINTLDKFKEKNRVIKSYVQSIHGSLNWLLDQDNTFKYQILGRMQSDCEYYLGFGRGNEERLWAQNVEKHILYMRELYKSLSEKPNWITAKIIDCYEKDMLRIKYNQ